MKRTSLTTLLLLVPLTLALSVEMSAQNAGAEKSKVNPALERALDQLEQGLKESVVIEPRQFGGVRKTYVRLKQRDGCNINFQVSATPSNLYANSLNRTPPDLSTEEWRVNLSDLDIAGVKIEKPAKSDLSVVRFATVGGKESIKWTGSGVGTGGWVSGGWFYIGKSASQVAAALGQAITACRE